MIDAEASATEVRDLRTGTAVWERYPHLPVATEPPLRSLAADVVIVGAGITGALVAEAATARGLSTVLLDRRPPAHGSTAASTALLQFEIDTPFTHLAEDLGFEPARRIWLRSYRAVRDLGRLIDGLGIPCDFRRRRALYLSGNLLGAAKLAEEGRQRRKIGLPSVFLGGKELRGFAGIVADAALLSEGAADVNPVALTRGLLLRAASRGARLLYPAELAEIAASDRKVAMATADGVELQARALIFATGYELAREVPSRGHRRTATWAFATPPQSAPLWGEGELIWEAATPYLYARSTVDRRVVVGGEDEAIDDDAVRDALIPQKIAALQTKCKELMPWLDVTADCAWAGTFGESDRGLPSIGPIPGLPNCYAVLGYGGNGLTFGVIAAQIIGGWLAGNPDPDAPLFEFAA